MKLMLATLTRLCAVPCALYCVRCTVCAVLCALYCVRCTVCAVPCLLPCEGAVHRACCLVRWRCTRLEEAMSLMEPMTPMAADLQLSLDQLSSDERIQQNIRVQWMWGDSGGHNRLSD